MKIPPSPMSPRRGKFKKKVKPSAPPEATLDQNDDTNCKTSNNSTEAKSDTTADASQNTKDSSLEKKAKSKTKHTSKNQKQKHVFEAGPDGKAQLAGTPKKELVKKSTEKKAEEYKRPHQFRANFTLLLEDPTGTMVEKKAKAITQLNTLAKEFELVDPSIVLYPWWECSPKVASPFKPADIKDEISLHRYCRTIYIGPNTPDKARINMHFGTSMTPSVREKKMSIFLMGVTTENFTKIQFMPRMKYKLDML